MIVKVIVDIPARQVNRSFDYLVPKQWEAAIKLGSRVQVPFARTERMAFVIDIVEESDFEGDLKEIRGILDYDSFLNEELILLSDYLARYLHSFRISVLQAMLPGMLRVKYQTYVEIQNPERLNQQLGSSYTVEDEILLKDLEKELKPNQINDLLNNADISIDNRLINQTTEKKRKFIRANKSTEDYQAIITELDSRSFKQKEVIQFFINHPSVELSKEALKEELNLGDSTINSLADKGWLEIIEKKVYRNPLASLEVEKSQSKKLTIEQAEAFKRINASIEKGENDTFLIEGVTGSGKTEIYLQLMDEVRKKGKSALLLVPEISLTPQMVERVVGRFQTGIAVLHSGLSLSEKYDEWRRIIKGEATIVVGARSSVFAPLENLGIIIIDEEHESTYKQSDNPRYHARDVAKWRTAYHSAPLVLGSATPSLESRARAEVGNYELIKLNERVNQKPMPPVELVDMTKLPLSQTSNEFSPLLIDKMQDRLNRKEQIVLLLNRRGYASYLLCRECGYIMQCPHCDISLTYHKTDNQMKCHYCDYKINKPQQCPQCQSNHLRTHGIGTQKIAESLNELFPQAKITRMDNDTTRRKGQHEKLLKEFGDKQTDILLGTQMIAKGLDFENVTLVGVINADTALNLPDFRAGERTFQLLTQVSGRPGRGKLDGEVIIQTYNPDHYVMQFVQNHDFDQFFYYEMKRRHLTNYPPYFFTTLIKISSKNNGNAIQMAYELKNQLYNKELEDKGLLYIVGPSRNNIAKIKDYYYYNILLKYKDEKLVQDKLDQILHESQKEIGKGIYVNIDHNQQFLL